ncbi:homoserine O-acetyltransferase [Propionibacterium cyclohexanicum]|uniref:Homoserine O-succinyltransferase n=1 Tax=Propionibacterium cyclohexanicum TaxID=64702 RepID=A0A1H9TFM5_9ACTN|nr:homoserine O-acetyltransferase [Propionibacterium cyclohexanicum]SER95754.1 homoserine O-acetyltransferase [Propionibacterium cyclohexanicum]
MTSSYSFDPAELVETQSVELFDADHPLCLVQGGTLPGITVAYETYGTLNDAGDNAIYICHALTGDAHASGWHDGDTRPGWWHNLIGPGRAVDTRRWFVVASNLLGGCQGTTGPSSINPQTGKPYGMDFPLLDMHDFVTVHRALLAHLGVRHLHAAVGGSLGGMQVLDWALSHPEDMDDAVVVASSSRLTAQNIAFSAVGREAIMRDENFDGGHFAEHHLNPDVGLAVARMMAHITYTSEEGFEEKFGRRPQFDAATRGFGVDFAVESYLDHQGSVFITRFDALSYLYLTRVMDYFDPFADPLALSRVQASPVNFLVMSFDSDWRFGTQHSRRIVRHLLAGGLPVSFREIHAPWGHDSFLLKIDPYLDTVRAFLERRQVHRSATHGQSRPHSRHPRPSQLARPRVDEMASQSAVPSPLRHRLAQEAQ